jgi:hypothetical protein
MSIADRRAVVTDTQGKKSRPGPSEMPDPGTVVWLLPAQGVDWPPAWWAAPSSRLAGTLML